MSDRSKIEWTDATWNPIRAQTNAPMGTVRSGWHCVKVSPGCANCYAERMNARLGTRRPYRAAPSGGSGMWTPNFESYLDVKALQAPLRWKKPRMIFVCSMTDLFGDWVREEFIDQIFAVMALCPEHTFQILTKRPDRMRKYLTRRSLIPGGTLGGEQPWKTPCDDVYRIVRKTKGDAELLWPLPNVWLGVSVEAQAFLWRLDELRRCPSAIRFLSAEPLLDCLMLNGRLSHWTNPDGSGSWFSAVPGKVQKPLIDWVIVGGESGPGARPMHADWARSLRDQCAAAGVPFFFKQWGEWVPTDDRPWGEEAAGVKDTTRHCWVSNGESPSLSHHQRMARVGKKRAGRLLDGVEHNGMPAACGGNAKNQDPRSKNGKAVRA